MKGIPCVHFVIVDMPLNLSRTMSKNIEIFCFESVMRTDCQGPLKHACLCQTNLTQVVWFVPEKQVSTHSY